MADRPNPHLNAYPMIPPNYPNIQQQQQQQQQQQFLLQQQQQLALHHQQQQQQAANGSHMHGLTNAETQQRLLEMQLKRQQMGVADGLVPQINQMPDFMRSQGMSQPHGQPLQMSNQANQFPLAHSNHQLQNHHAQTPSLQSAIRPPMSNQASFPNGMGPQQTTPTQLLARGVNPAVIHAIQSNPQSFQRQLGLLGVARNQQPQNGPVAAMGIQPQVIPQGLGAQPGLGRPPYQAGTFQVQGNPPQQVQPNPPLSLQQLIVEFVKAPDGRTLPPEAIRKKCQALRVEIESIRANIGRMSQSQSADIIPTIRNQQSVMQAKEAIFTRVMALLNNMQQQQQHQSMPQVGGDGGGDMSGQSFVNRGPQASLQQQPQPQQQWMAQMNGGPSNQVPPGLPQQMPNMTPQAQHQEAVAPSSPFHPSLAQGQPAPPIPRTTQTPQQQQMPHLMRPPATSPQPHAGVPVLPPTRPPSHQPSAVGQHLGPRPDVPGQMTIPFLFVKDRAQFDGLISRFHTMTSHQPDSQMLNLGDRRVDLFQLHVEVGKRGGAKVVKQHDQWTIIGAAMGWVMTPAHGNEPARSPPQVAAHLERLYEHALEKFEQWYQTFERHRLATIARQTGQPNPAAQLGNALMGNGQINAAALIAMSSDKLREMGQPEHVIQIIEQRRNAYIMSQQERLRQQAQAQAQQVQAGQVAMNMASQLGGQGMQMPPQQGPHGPVQPPQGPEGPNMNAIAAQQLQAKMAAAAGLPPNMAALQQQHQQLQQQQQAQPRPPFARAPGDPPLTKPTTEQLLSAQLISQKFREEAIQSLKSTPYHPKNVPEQERQQYMTTFDQVFKISLETEKTAFTYHALLKDDNKTRMIFTHWAKLQRQRALLTNNPPEFILNVEDLKTIGTDLLRERHAFMTAIREVQPQSDLKRMGLPVQQPGGRPGMPPQMNGTNAPSLQQHLPAATLQQQSQQPQPSAGPSSVQIHPAQHPQQPQQPPQPSQLQPQQHIHQPRGIQTPVPAAAAHTPIQRPPTAQRSTPAPANAPTPNSAASMPTPHPRATPVLQAQQPPPKPKVQLGVESALASSPAAASPGSQVMPSPQTPKSPKTKGTPKTKAQAPPVKRRMSKAQPPSTVAEVQTPSSAGAAPIAAPAPAPVSAPAPAPSVHQPEHSLKRPREDDTPSVKAEPEASTSSVVEAPAPKRARSEWSDVPPPDGGFKEEEEENEIKTEEQATAFITQMSELLMMNDSAISPELTDAISQIVKSAGSFDAADLVGASSSTTSGAGGLDFSGAGSRSPKQDDFIKYFDFSSFDDKVDTPDLVPTSSTNPSPESNSEPVEGHGMIGSGSLMSSGSDLNGVKDSTKPSTMSSLSASYEPTFDQLRMGSLGEIDGGESAYYSTMPEWKWDTMMTSGTDPWAIMQTPT